MQKLSSFFKAIHPKYWIYDFVRFTWTPALYLLQRPKILFCNKEGKMPRIKGRAIIVSNHTWWMDPITVILTFWRRRLYSLAAVEVLGPSRFARFVRNSILFVDVDRTKLDIRSFNRCVQLLRDDRCLLIFPEGRFVFDDEVQPFKGGTALMAMQTGAPIYPVYIHGLYRLFHPIYMAVGDPIDVASLIDGAPDSAKVQAINDLMRERVNDLRLKLEASIPEKELSDLRKFKAEKRAALAAKAEERARAWREAQEKGKV
ncbi:MAG: 1-acyl-sn-glycerol-3-phosphate acyltransferase [Clostridia bacterium]|nr:1-acyl-sn-glycerol-3-phosphate acyltransferase [Clostridia bacterium]